MTIIRRRRPTKRTALCSGSAEWEIQGEGREVGRGDQRGTFFTYPKIVLFLQWVYSSVTTKEETNATRVSKAVRHQTKELTTLKLQVRWQFWVISVSSFNLFNLFNLDPAANALQPNFVQNFIPRVPKETKQTFGGMCMKGCTRRLEYFQLDEMLQPGFECFTHRMAFMTILQKMIFYNFNATKVGERQRALTPLEELDGSLASAVTVFHITGIISQVLLLQRVNSQRNGHFLLTKMLLDHPATQRKTHWAMPAAGNSRYLCCCARTCNQCVCGRDGRYVSDHRTYCVTATETFLHNFTVC